MRSEMNLDELQTLIEESGVNYSQNSVSWVFTCPKCQKKDKLYIRKKDGRFVCWVCRERERYEGFAVEYALRDLLGLRLDELKKRLYGEVEFRFLGPDLDLDFDGLRLPGEPVQVPKEVPEAPVVPFPADFYPIASKQATKGANYLAGRGIPVEIASEYGIMYSVPDQRVVFPIRVEGRVRGWQARTIRSDIDPAYKILSTKEIPRDSTLMFQERLGFHDHAVLCEGPVDAIKAHLCGGNVAAMGKVVTNFQLEILRRAGVKKLYIALDPDAGSEIQGLIQRAADFQTYLLLPPSGAKDLGDCTFSVVLEQFQAAIRVNRDDLFFDFGEAY